MNQIEFQLNGRTPIIHDPNGLLHGRVSVTYLYEHTAAGPVLCARLQAGGQWHDVLVNPRSRDGRAVLEGLGKSASVSIMCDGLVTGTIGHGAMRRRELVAMLRRADGWTGKADWITAVQTWWLDR